MLAIIPARGGSKRIPKKNIRLFNGRPMITYAIETALRSGLFDEVSISTDCPDIADIALEHGAIIHALRSKELSDDFTPTHSVIQETLKLHYPDLDDSTPVCCVYPCTPLLTVDHLIQAERALTKHQAVDQYIFPVLEFSSAPQRALSIDAEGNLKSEYPAYEKKRTQDLKPLFYDAGQFYLGTKKCWLSNPEIHGNAIPIVMKKSSLVDIDTLEDWEMAERQYQLRKSAISPETQPMNRVR